MSSASSASEFELRSCKIFPNDGRDPIVVSLSLIQFFVYSENITSPFVAGRMEIVDAGGLLNAVPIQGTEKIEIVVKTTINPGLITYSMRIFTVQGRYAQNNIQTYTIGMVTEEALGNEVVRLSAPIEGTGDQIAAKLLTEQLNSQKDFFSEPTLFKTKLLPIRRRPFDIISSIATKSISTKSSFNTPETDTEEFPWETTESVKGSAGFYFWENKRGYNFFSLDALCDVEGKQFAAPSLQSQSWGPYVEQLANDDIADTQFSIQFSHFGSDLNLLESLRKGKYSTRVATFNFSTGEYDEVEYNISSAYENIAHLGGITSQPQLSTGEKDLTKQYSRIIVSIIDHETWYNEGGPASPEEQDGGTDPSEFADWVKYYAAQSNARYELLKQQQCTIVIPGNSEICAGDKVTIKLKSKLPNEESRTEPYDQESSGVYLVYEVAHNYSLKPPSSGNGHFTSTLVLCRDSSGVNDAAEY